MSLAPPNTIYYTVQFHHTNHLSDIYVFLISQHISDTSHFHLFEKEKNVFSLTIYKSLYVMESSSAYGFYFISRHMG